MTDNTPDQGFTPNLMPGIAYTFPDDHDFDDDGQPIHRYEVKGSSVFWAECACGEKLAGDNGPIVGSRSKIESAIEAST